MDVLSKACLIPCDERTRLQKILTVIADKWCKLIYWWPRHAKKYDLATFNGKTCYEAEVGYRTSVLYDCDGYQIGWRGQSNDGNNFFKPTPTDNVPRMPFLSRLWSPKIK